MLEITFTIQSPNGTVQAALTKDRLTIGQSASADIHIEDSGLSDIHSSIHRQDERVWILDENSLNGSYVNARLVPGHGTPLKDGDEISLGNSTIIFVHIIQPSAPIVKSHFQLIAVLVLILIALATVAALGPRMFKRTTTNGNHQARAGFEKDVSKKPDKAEEVRGAIDLAVNSNLQPAEPQQQAKGSAPRKLYIRMNEDEQNEFIYSQARNVSRMMSNREYVFTDDVLPYIKKYVDGYARRVGNRSTAIWGEDLTSLFSRARRLAPDIIREFNARGVPKVVGLYIPMIESEYRECLTSPVGAKGLFQFMPATARGYGVDPGDRCDVKKMAPAAAKYIKDRIAEFGSDAMSVALGIAGYNRSPDSVRRDLNDVINGRNKERSFWTLVANSDKLDRFFQNENIKYVPKFFAAAIVGENPWAFGLEMNPLSTYAGEPSRDSGS
jgi:pSer/pThr/pTyr-binding forkhead associated (FHA) protein